MPAFNPAPSAWLPNAVLNTNTFGLVTATAGTGITLPELTNTEAHPSTGDIRSVVHAILEQLWVSWVAAGAVDATMGRPVNMVVGKSVSVDPVTNDQTFTYSMQLKMQASGFQVKSEPS